MTSGGFGPVHAFLAVPAVLAAGVLLYRKRIAASQRWPLAMVLGLFVLGLMGPNPWWPRHILASSLASMVLLGAMFARLPRRLELGLTSLALTGALAFAGVAASQGIDGYREHGWVEPIRIGAAARSALASGPLWPAEMIEERNATFGHDDVFAYERAVWLPAQFTPWDFGSRVIWIEPEGSAADYLVRLRGANARWVVLRSARWRAGLIALGAQEVYRHNDEVVLDLSEIPTE